MSVIGFYRELGEVECQVGPDPSNIRLLKMHIQDGYTGPVRALIRGCSLGEHGEPPTTTVTCSLLITKDAGLTFDTLASFKLVEEGGRCVSNMTPKFHLPDLSDASLAIHIRGTCSSSTTYRVSSVYLYNIHICEWGAQFDKVIDNPVRQPSPTTQVDKVIDDPGRQGDRQPSSTKWWTTRSTR